MATCAALYEAASALLTHFKRKDKVKTWALAIAKRASHRKAVVAVARKLAVIMQAMWVDGTFCGDPTAVPADVWPTPRSRRASCCAVMHKTDGRLPSLSDAIATR